MGNFVLVAPSEEVYYTHQSSFASKNQSSTRVKSPYATKASLVESKNDKSITKELNKEVASKRRQPGVKQAISQLERYSFPPQSSK